MSKKIDWEVSLLIQKTGEEQAERVFNAIIDAVEKEGLFCGGGMKPYKRRGKG